MPPYRQKTRHFHLAAFLPNMKPMTGHFVTDRQPETQTLNLVQVGSQVALLRVSRALRSERSIWEEGVFR